MNWYTTRCALKRAGEINGVDKDPIVDRHIESASRFVSRRTRRCFIPSKQTRTYRWPDRFRNNRGTVLWLDQDLVSVCTLQSEAQNSCPTTISACDFFVEPNNTGPPFDRIEIDLSSCASFSSGDTPQRSISVNGLWGFSNDKTSAGTVASGLACCACATSMVVSDASRVCVGHTLCIECEQIFVSDRSFAALDSILVNDACIAAQQNDVTITVDACHGIKARETIKLDSEEMFVTHVSGNDLTVQRAYNGTVLAAHCDCTAVQINRTLTVERGVNGTTAATHADCTAICRYEPEHDIQNWTLALALASLTQENAHWGRSVGTGEGAQEFRSVDLANLTKDMTKRYQRSRMAAV